MPFSFIRLASLEPRWCFDILNLDRKCILSRSFPSKSMLGLLAIYLSQTQHKSKMKLSLAKMTTVTTRLVRNDVDGNYYCDCSNQASLQFESHKMTCWTALHCVARSCLCCFIIRRRSGNSQSYCTVSRYLIQRTH